MKVFGTLTIKLFLCLILICSREVLGLSTWQPPPISMKKLENGLKLYMLPDHQLPLFEAKLLIHIGSASEDPEKAGLTDLLLHLLVSGGTKNKTPEEMDQWLDQKAIHLSSEGGKELLTIQVSSLATQWEEALDFLYESVFEPRWDVERFQLTLSRYKDNLKRSLDIPETVLARAFQETLYGPKNPWGVLVTSKTLQKIKREDLLSFYDKYFHPELMLLAVAGDVDQKKIHQWALKKIGSLPSKISPKVVWDELPFLNQFEKKKIKKNVTQSFIEVGHLSLKRRDPDQYAYALLQYILGGEPFTSRLGRDIRSDRGLAYTVYSNWTTNPLRGLFKIHVETKAESTELALERILHHLKEIQKEGNITETELIQAKEAIINQYIFWFDSPFDSVMNQARFDLLGFEADYLKKYPERIRNVTLKEIQAVAQKYLEPDKVKIVIVGP